MNTTTWLMIAMSDSKTWMAQTNINDDKLINKAISKWIIRGNASNNLSSFWEYIDQYDNNIEDALLDQLEIQSKTTPDDPQITSVKEKDHSVDILVKAKSNNKTSISCSITFTLFVYFRSLKKKLEINNKTININVLKLNGKIEKINVSKSLTTLSSKNKRIKKRSKIETTTTLTT